MFSLYLAPFMSLRVLSPDHNECRSLRPLFVSGILQRTMMIMKSNITIFSAYLAPFILLRVLSPDHNECRSFRPLFVSGILQRVLMIMKSSIALRFVQPMDLSHECPFRLITSKCRKCRDL